MRNSIWIFGATLGLAALILKGIEIYYTVNLLPTGIYIGIIAVLFVGLGIWVWKKFMSISSQKTEQKPFKINEQAAKSLDLSMRELDILEQLGKGHSDQEIADKLFISVNTVKKHLSSIYKKLNVSRRSRASKKARLLKLIQ
jgi:DNA-binding NarL/FixJ family response regulator